MRDDQKVELRRVQEMAVDHAIDEMDEAHGRTLDDAESRGDRRWLTQMAASSLKVAMQIEQFIALRDRPDMYKTPANEASNEEATRRMIAAAEAKVVEITQKKRA